MLIELHFHLDSSRASQSRIKHNLRHKFSLSDNLCLGHKTSLRLKARPAEHPTLAVRALYILSLDRQLLFSFLLHTYLVAKWQLTNCLLLAAPPALHSAVGSCYQSPSGAWAA